jgi:N-acetylglucosamine transport system substrate-binding protein
MEMNMKKFISFMIALAMLLALTVTGCSKNTPTSSSGEAQGFKGRTLEVLFQSGGSGDYYAAVIEQMKADFPDLTINYVYDVGANDMMKTRTLAGNAPDIFNLNAGLYSFFNAISEDILLPLDDILATDSFVEGKTLGDIVDANLLDANLVDGKRYLMPEVLFTSGTFYDASLLAKYDIEAPKTWDDFVAAMETLNDNDVKGFGYCGLMAHEYPLDYYFWPSLISINKQAYIDTINLEDTAWDSAAMKELVARFVFMRDQGLLDKTTIALGNNETQMQFIAHGFGFLPCGSWLEAEMADAWTDEWDLAYLPFSGRNSESDSNYINVIPLYSGVYSESANIDIAKVFYKYLFSDDTTIKNVVTIAQNGLPIADFSTNYGSLLNKSVSQTWQAIADGSKSFACPYGMWYSDLPQAFKDNFNALMSGDIDGDEFRANMAAAGKAVKEDAEIVKYKLEG